MAEPQKSQVQQLDPNMRLEEKETDGIRWYSPKEAPFQLAGFPWLEQEGLYRRLPAKPSHPIRTPVDQLADCTSGGQVRFRTNSGKLFVKVVLTGSGSMYHMPATGQCGFDCYIGEIGAMKYVSTTRFDHTLTEYTAPLFDWPSLSGESRPITLNFPLYTGVKELYIGLMADASLEAPTSYASDKKIIVYGTSITQGGCANRPGMSYTNILSRRIPYEFINVGFSGNGLGEPELAHILSEIERPALLVLDYEANVGAAENLQRTLPEFIRIYRERHADVPILVCSRILYARDRFEPELAALCDIRRSIAQETVASLQEAGDRRIEFFDGGTLLGNDYDECTVDGVHPTDLGFQRMADGLEPAFRRMLETGKEG
ncbi:SGNH/GDSL hydrolase family protein [Paenibacillus sp. HJGM_3]|uniref:SGNH/GDSL hydrolase family protein n=1 Tax=Paenibacillus sp. HJGM_3 TaxID=3379816 RepID=UPI00385AB2E9